MTWLRRSLFPPWKMPRIPQITVYSNLLWCYLSPHTQTQSSPTQTHLDIFLIFRFVWIKQCHLCLWKTNLICMTVIVSFCMCMREKAGSLSRYGQRFILASEMRHRLTQTFAVILSYERTNHVPHPNAPMTAEGRAVNGEKLNGFVFFFLS